MSKFIPDMYCKNILEIDYQKLKDLGIKVLLFDFDNTIIAHKVYELDKNYISLLKKIKKDFKVYIISNSFNSKKLSKFSNEFKIPYIGRSLKPLSWGFKKLKLDTQNKNIAMIGDQIITDVFGGNRRGYYSILIDPINRDSEIVFTKINRKIEEFIIKREKQIKRGDYFD